MMKKLKSVTILMSVFMSATLAACNSTSIPLSSSAETKLTMEAISDVDENESTYEETIESDTQEDVSFDDSKARGPMDRGGMMSTSNDPEIQAVLDENSEKFKQFTYNDETTGITLDYSLYIPENYDESQKYPLLVYIPDSTGAGKTASEIVEEYYGATVWVTDEDQAKHASFVLVPAFSETVVNDNWDVSEEVNALVNLLSQLQKDYSIDSDRLYTTGQSMGCMTSLYLNSKYPDLFAASLFVSGQWDISVLEPLENETFFYMTAGGDERASGGQDEVMKMLDTDGVEYTYGTWNAQNSEDEQNAAVEELLSENLPINMIRFETGTVFKEGQSGMEHMASFNYAYKISAVRDWLFEQ
ncbi:alpha/beta hydrolase-fold protein [Oribacterium sp. WCC10]|uniref:carboxylesterase family protein n=1 Tax=Oribacterium sp. WCC10 TaxID=1855343 RepID=UPI000B80F721|nr:alpha/beta hydrolase-fold protein [Oribacterium sp. WCC10]